MHAALIPIGTKERYLVRIQSGNVMWYSDRGYTHIGVLILRMSVGDWEPAHWVVSYPSQEVTLPKCGLKMKGIEKATIE